MHEIYLLIPPGKTEAEKLVGWSINADGTTQVITPKLQDIAALKPSRCTVVVPAHCLSWHSIELPQGINLQGDNRLLPILQNKLEEELLDDLTNAHIALAPIAQKGQATMACVCDSSWLGAWVKRLEENGITVDRIAPEVAPDMLTLGSICTARQHQSWVSSAWEDGVTTMPIDAQSAAIGEQANFLATGAAHSDAEEAFGAEHVQLLTEQEYVQLLQKSAWDLAQHQFASNRANRFKRKLVSGALDFMHTPQWRPARWACYATVAVLVVGLNAKAMMQESALKAKQSLINSTAQEAFPNLTVLIDPPAQMARELKNLKQRAGILAPNDFLPMASAIGAATKGSASKPTHITYSQQEFQVGGLSEADVESTAQKLIANGYHATVSNGELKVRWEK